MKHVADLKRGEEDNIGATVERFYAFKPPEYAVFRTGERVTVVYADDRVTRDAQRARMAALNPVRGEIDGLVGHWRNKPAWELFGIRDRTARAEFYDRRVGDALVVAMEGDIAGAHAVLSAVKEDLLEERTATARFWYLGTAFSVLLVVVGAVAVFPRDGLLPEGRQLAVAVAAGAAGAFFSVAVGLRGRTVLPDLQLLPNLVDAVLRVLVGTLAAPVLAVLVKLKVVNLSLGETPVGETESLLHVLLVGFLAGFAERLVPDLLAGARVAERSGGTSDAAVGGAPPSGERSQVDGASQPSVERSSESPADDPEAHVETCSHDGELGDDEVTPDEQLPPATGGVASALTGR